MPETPPLITIIVAAYNRGPILAKALRTVIAQTETRWVTLVIGDSCSDDTADRIAALGDDRIRFVNLPERFGEQAGPNSVGIALVETPYTAFLNQDDFWMPDHLETSLSEINKAKAHLFWAHTVSCFNRGGWNDRALFIETPPKDIQLKHLFSYNYRIAEPISKWFIRTPSLRRLGPMKLASEIQTVPILDFAQRCFHSGLRMATGDKITVINDHVWYPAPNYRNTAPYADQWVESIESGNTKALRETIEEELWLSRNVGLESQFTPDTLARSHGASEAIQGESGVWLDALKLKAREQDSPLLERYLKERTGTSLRRQPSLDTMITFARQALQ